MRPSGSLIGLRIQLTQNWHFANAVVCFLAILLKNSMPYPFSLPPGPKNSRLARCYEKSGALMQRLGLEHSPTFSKNHLKPALAAGLIEMIDPALPCNPMHKYRRTTGSGFSKGYDRLAD